MFWVARLDHARLAHFQPQVVAFARAFADAAEHREPAMLLGNVVDQFHNDDGLPDAGAAEESNLPALQEGLNQIDDLDAGLEHLRRRRLLFEAWRGTVNRIAFRRSDWAQIVDRFANHIHDSAKGAAPDRNGNGAAEVDGFHPANHAVGRLHGNGAHATFAQMLLHFEDDFDRHGNVEAVADHAQGLINRRHGRLGELHVHCGTGDLNYVSNVFHKKSS